MRVVIIGAGGHGTVVADILRAARQRGADIGVVGFADDRLPAGTVILDDVRVIGRTDQLASIDHDAIVIAIGDNATRARFFEKFSGEGRRFAAAVHPSAIVGADVVIGPGTMVCAGVVINTGSRIGPNAILNTSCSVDHHNRIGSHVHVAPGVHTGGEVTIGDGALVGIGATVLPGRTIGRWTVVGAGAVVTRDVADMQRATGVPARVATEPL